MHDVSVVDGLLLLLVSCHVLRCHVLVFLHRDGLLDYLFGTLEEWK